MRLISDLSNEDAKSPQVTEQADSDDGENRQTASHTIVCVDNSFVNLTSIRLMLEMTGYKGDIECF